LSIRGITQLTLIDTDEHTELGYVFPPEIILYMLLDF
jgi:hypothetical protein